MILILYSIMKFLLCLLAICSCLEIEEHKRPLIDKDYFEGLKAQDVTSILFSKEICKARLIDIDKQCHQGHGQLRNVRKTVKINNYRPKTNTAHGLGSGEDQGTSSQITAYQIGLDKR